MKKILQFFIKAFVVFFIIITFVFAYLSLFHKDLLLHYLDIIKSMLNKLGYWNYVIIFLFAFFESFPLIGVSIPGQTVLLIVAGFLGYNHIIFSSICAVVGALAGNFFGYLLGIKYGDSFFKKYGILVGITKTDVKYIKKGIEKHGWLLVVFGKFHNMFRAFVPFIAGSSKMNNWLFTLLNIIGSFLRGVTMVILGVFFVENAEVILENIGKILLIIIIGFAFYIYFFKKEEVRKYLEEKQLEFEDKNY